MIQSLASGYREPAHTGTHPRKRVRAIALGPHMGHCCTPHRDADHTALAT